MNKADLLCTFDEASLISTATRCWTLNTQKTEQIFFKHKTLYISCVSAHLYQWIYLLPLGDEPLQLALFLAASEETGFLTGRFLQTCTLAVRQRVSLSSCVVARTRNSSPLQTAATLTRTLQIKKETWGWCVVLWFMVHGNTLLAKLVFEKIRFFEHVC